MDAEKVAALFAQNFAEAGELGASVSVWKDGREVISLADGWTDREKTSPWTRDTPVLFWSATKGLASTCLLHACSEHGISLTSRVSEFWPEFAQAGKGAMTIAQLLSHQGGLSIISTPLDVFDYDGIVTALAAEPPHWPIGEGHGYHARTFGFLLDELLRRITGGTPLGRYWRERFGEPMGIDVWIGVPPEVVDRVACVYPARTAPPKGDMFYTAFLTAGSFTARAFTSPRGLHGAAAMNKPEVLTSSFPGFGGVGTGSGLAKFYAMLANGGELEGRRYLDTFVIDWMSTTLTQGADKVLLLETAFSAGFMRDPVDEHGVKVRQTFGPSGRAFGHPGAGGSHAFADPETGLSFAYVMNQMEPGVLPNQKSLRIVDALYA
jgi:CubicO group peptidase (beta-lactamase class C family)